MHELFDARERFSAGAEIIGQSFGEDHEKLIRVVIGSF
jgi:hypothetical protein